jgi:hypothetical protein
MLRINGTVRARRTVKLNYGALSSRNSSIFSKVLAVSETNAEVGANQSCEGHRNAHLSLSHGLPD